MLVLGRASLSWPNECHDEDTVEERVLFSAKMVAKN